MTMLISAIILTIFAIVALRHLVLPALWKPMTEPCTNQDECHGSQLGPTECSKESGVVRVISLTDDGEFVDRCELTDATYEVKNCRGPEIIVWYIHGWKHNADPDDSDLRNFKKLISQLDDQQHQIDQRERRRVVGIYIAWDGAVGPSLLRNLTFWNRKRAADRISQSSVLTKIIAGIRYARAQVGSEITAKDLTIMIGHSFGARILFTATSQVLVDEVQRQHPGFVKSSYGVMSGPADLILLINPAFEASIFTAMNSVRRPASNWWESISPRQQPLLLAIGTENDWATRRAFPLGQFVEFARRKRQRETLGNYKEYFTHSLQAVEQGQLRQQPGSPWSHSNATASRCANELAPKVQPELGGPEEQNSFWYDSFQAAGLILLRTATRQPGNPFLVACTTSDIIDGHNGIWGNRFKSWIIGFLVELDQHRLAAEDQSIRRSQAPWTNASSRSSWSTVERGTSTQFDRNGR
jgi:hypothetical protein